MTKKAETWRLVSNQIGEVLRDHPSATRLDVKKGEAIYLQGTPGTHVHVLLCGRVRVSMMRSDGYEFLLEIMGPGAVLGEAAALDGQPHFSSAVSEEPSELLQLPVRDLRTALSDMPSLAEALLAVTAAKQRVLARRLLALTQASPKSRIVEMLLRLSAIYGRREEGEMLIETRLSHEQIAALIGVTRVTVTRALTELTNDGVIRVERTAVRILDLDQLENLYNQ